MRETVFLVIIIVVTVIMIVLRYKWCNKTFKWLQYIGKINMNDNTSKDLWFHRSSRKFIVSDKSENCLRNLKTSNIHDGDNVKIEKTLGTIKLNK